METFQLMISHDIVQGCAKKLISVQRCRIPQTIDLAWPRGCTTGIPLHCPQPTSPAGSSPASQVSSQRELCIFPFN